MKVKNDSLPIKINNSSKIIDKNKYSGYKIYQRR